MKINIIGWYDRNNCGDESFRYVFNDIFLGQEIVYSTKNIIENCDHYILGGGDVVKDFYINNIPNNVNLNCIGVGLGYESESILLKKLNLNSIFIRNKKDVKILEDIGIKSKYTPDIVFKLKKPDTINENIKSNRKNLAVILTDHVNPSVVNKNIKEFNYNEYFKWELAEALDILCEYYKIYFIALSDSYCAIDNKMHMDVQSRMNFGYKTSLIIESKNPFRLMDTLQQMDVVLSMKFHGMIFSNICHVPFINIGKSRKTQEYCKEQNLEDLSFEPKTFNKENALKKFQYIEQNSNEIRQRLSNVDSQNKKVLEENIENWKNLNFLS